MKRIANRCHSCGRNLPLSGAHLCAPIIDLTGKVYERLTVVRMLPERLRGSTMWECLCECGKIKTTSSNLLRTGHVKSCGCLNVEKYSAPRKHGLCESPTYQAWRDMKRRCLNSRAKNYHSYGGRGIRICERWLTFENFLSDMGQRPSEELSLERIDNDGNYEPGNCKWGTLAEQNRNTRRNRWIEIDGRKLTLSEWSRELGVSISGIRSRLSRGAPLAPCMPLPVDALATA